MNTKNVVVIGLVGLVLLGLLGATAWVVTAYRPHPPDSSQ